MTIRETLSVHFQAPMQNMSFVSYLTYLNSAGKITQRSLLDILIVLCDQIEAQEKQSDVFMKNFKDIEEILSGLLKKQSVVEVELSNPTMTGSDNAVSSVSSETSTQQGEASAFPCDKCNKTFNLKVALAGHKRSHK